ncbi:MAG: DegT/DnrJ/EryC1/StrS family aminotransferase [Candidatus Omnitrophota bacterium]|nr:DegT/DnrJ/EryC1/StrS family aminotransferase [Candidatus Omnitrophota bacterium]
MIRNPMKVAFGTMTVTKKSKDMVRRILDSGRVSCGYYVREFEKRFARLIATRQAVAVSSGTDADALALAIFYDFGAKRNDEVIVPALSFVATGNAVLQAGFKPVFVDIDPKTLNIDTDLIERAVTKKTRAIMPVHLMGKPAAMDEINHIARKHQLFVVEDAAEAHGAMYKGRHVGTLGDLGAFSLYVAHIITSIEGGMVVTERKDFAEILRSLRSHGRACKCEQCVVNIASASCPKRFQYGAGEDMRFLFERIGFSAKMNEIEAAVGLGNLGIYKKILERRRRNLLYLMKRFKKNEEFFYSIEEESYEKIGPHAFPVVVRRGAPFRRQDLVCFLTQNNIDSRSLFSSMPTQCSGFSFLGHRYGDFPAAEYIGENGLHIGVHQDLGVKHLDYILATFTKFIKKFTK